MNELGEAQAVDVSGASGRQRLFLLTQYYQPDDTSTSRYLTELSESFAEEFDVTVVCGTPEREAGSDGQSPRPHLAVVRLSTRAIQKSKIAQRLGSMLQFSWRCFRLLQREARRGDRIFVVTTPAALPYFVLLAAKLRRAKAVLILYDLYPDVLVASGLVRERSIVVSVLRLANNWLFSGLDRIVVIGDDMKRRVEARSRRALGKTVVIPNWTDLDTAAIPGPEHNVVRARLPRHAGLVVGLSGNLGFVHDPMTVLRAARRLAGRSDIHFLLSGWGVGWTELVEAVAREPLVNATLIDRVPQEHLTHLLDAADVWIIPYKRDMDGVSVPSRFYNLLAIGKPIVTLAGPDADHSRLIGADGIGWVVPPENDLGLSEVIAKIADDPASLAGAGQRARKLADERFSRRVAAAAYRDVARATLPDNR